MVKLVLAELDVCATRPLLLDGVHVNSSLIDSGCPRTIPQAETIDKTFPINVVINIDVPFDAIIDRLKVVHLFSFVMLFRIECTTCRVVASTTMSSTLPKLPYVRHYSVLTLQGLDDVTGEKLQTREDDKVQ